MPFTFSHPAIVLPFHAVSKKWVSITALITGSIMPDFEAFLRMKSVKDHSHTWLGILWFSLPVGLLLAFVFHLVIRNTLIDHLPQPLQKRFSAFKSFNWNQRFKQNWLVIVISLIIGAVTHFLWDSFSHYDGFLIKSIPALQNDARLLGYNLEIPFLIQYVNSLLGLLGIAFAIWRLPADEQVQPNKAIYNFWMKVVVVASGIYTLRLVSMDGNKPDDLIIAAFSAFFLSLTFIALMSAKSKQGSTLT